MNQNHGRNRKGHVSGTAVLATAVNTTTTSVPASCLLNRTREGTPAALALSDMIPQFETSAGRTSSGKSSPTNIVPRPTGRATAKNDIPSTSSSSTSADVAPLNWSLLTLLWSGDVAIAVVVTAAVAPTLTIVDKAIVEQSAGNGQSGRSGILLRSMRHTASSILLNPTAYFRSATFGWMWLTYAATYTTANLLKTWQEHQSNAAAENSKRSDASSSTSKSTNRNSGTLLVAGTTMVNSGASLLKDRAYARMFGQSQAAQVPMTSYLAWMMRDGVVIGSSFVLPAHVTPLVQDATGWSPKTAATVSQLLTPVTAQLVAGPLHLWGLTLYNHASSASPATFYMKVRAWQQGLASVTLARMLRILPGYGVAGVANQRGRAWWKEQLLQAQVRRKQEGNASTMVALIRSLSNQK